ncbi:hypothetical protein BH23CHL7_BH23CHL7_17430 [soil metagenome]
MVATLAQAQSDLGPYVARLKRCVERAIRDFMGDHAPHLHKLETRTQANILRDYMISNIRAEFPEDEPGVSHVRKRNLYLLTIRNGYFLRFKKLDRRHRTRNHPTQLSLDFLLQQPLELFPTLHPATNLNVGYQPGVTLASSSVWITCPDGDVLDWKWSLSEAAEPTQLLVTNTRTTTPAVKRGSTRVHPKPAAADADQADGANG